MSIIKEFKNFAVRGNVLDLAVGIVIGAAFGKIVTSIVSDLIMPPLGVIIGGVNFTDIKLILKNAVIDETGKEIVPMVALKIGNFIQTVFDFTIIAFAVFMVIKAMNKIKRKEEEKNATPPPPTKEQELLTEIRDLLKNRS